MPVIAAGPIGGPLDGPAGGLNGLPPWTCGCTGTPVIRHHLRRGHTSCSDKPRSSASVETILRPLESFLIFSHHQRLCPSVQHVNIRVVRQTHFSSSILFFSSASFSRSFFVFPNFPWLKVRLLRSVNSTWRYGGQFL